MSDKKQVSKYEKTKTDVLTFIKEFRHGNFASCNEYLYNIRTGDLRELLPELGNNHLFYRCLLQVLQKPELDCHCEALYNLAVVLGDKNNVESLLQRGVMQIVFGYMDHPDSQIKHYACWCLFGIASSTIQNRDMCCNDGVLHKVIEILLSRPPKNVEDICGQIIYGMFHMQTLPDHEKCMELLDNINELLRLSSHAAKYLLWSLHFLTASDLPLLLSLNVEESLISILNGTNDTAVLMPTLTIITNVFVAGGKIDITLFHMCLTNSDPVIKRLAARAIAEYIRGQETAHTILVTKMSRRLIVMGTECDIHIAEQAAYALLRFYGLGNPEDKKQLTSQGALQVILSLSPKVRTDFAYNLLDCILSLVNEDSFYLEALSKLDTQSILLVLLSSNDAGILSKANAIRNLLQNL